MEKIDLTKIDCSENNPGIRVEGNAEPSLNLISVIKKGFSKRQVEILQDALELYGQNNDDSKLNHTPANCEEFDELVNLIDEMEDS